MTFSNERYQSLKEIFASQRLPLAFVDLAAFDANVEYTAGIAKVAGRNLRIATKSMRCLPFSIAIKALFGAALQSSDPGAAFGQLAARATLTGTSLPSEMACINEVLDALPDQLCNVFLVN